MEVRGCTGAGGDRCTAVGPHHPSDIGLGWYRPRRALRNGTRYVWLLQPDMLQRLCRRDGGMRLLRGADLQALCSGAVRRNLLVPCMRIDAAAHSAGSTQLRAPALHPRNADRDRPATHGRGGAGEASLGAACRQWGEAGDRESLGSTPSGSTVGSSRRLVPASGLSSLALDFDARAYAFDLLKIVFAALDNREDLSLLHTYAVLDHQSASRLRHLVWRRTLSSACRQTPALGNNPHPTTVLATDDSDVPARRRFHEGSRHQRQPPPRRQLPHPGASRGRWGPLSRPRRRPRLPRRLRPTPVRQLPHLPTRRRALLPRRPLRGPSPEPHPARRRHRLRYAAVLVRHARPAQDRLRPPLLLHLRQRPPAAPRPRHHHRQEGRPADLQRGELHQRHRRCRRPVRGSHPLPPPGARRRCHRQRQHPR